MAARSIPELAQLLACCAEELDLADQEAQLALFRLLARRGPVEPADLAREIGADASDAVARLRRWHGVQTDGAGRIVAFQGLSLVETSHRLRIGGRQLYAWCAWDTLFLPELIGASAEIESTCPATGAPIALRVGPQGPADASPPDTVLSFLLSDGRFGEDSIAGFCNFIHYLASPDAAEQWTAERPGTFVISIEEAFEIGRRTNAGQLGDALRAANG